MRSNTLLFWRAGSVGLACGSGAVVAHAATGGQVTALGFVLIMAVALMFGAGLVRCQHTLPTALGATLALQAMAHLVFYIPMESSQHHSGAGSAVMQTATPHMAMGDGYNGLAGIILMALGHLSAAFVTALLAAGVDRAWLDIARSWLAAWTRHLSPDLAIPWDDSGIQVWTAWRPAAARWAGSSFCPRGPPDAMGILPSAVS